MKFTDKRLQLICLVLIFVAITIVLLRVAPAKPYIAKNAVVYEKVWHADGSVTLHLSKNTLNFAYHTTPEAHKHTYPIYQITLKNVLCRLVKCPTCNPTE